MFGDIGDTSTMPWMTKDLIEQRYEFVTLASVPGANVAGLCRRFGLSRQCGYKWLQRFAKGGKAALVNQSRRPHHSPAQLSSDQEKPIIKLRRTHPTWGARKLLTRLGDTGHTGLPSASTVHQVLVRSDLVEPRPGGHPKPWQRFQRETPNELWQMDFKGHFALANAQRCHPLTILDDHSRYSLCLRARPGQTDRDVRPYLEQTFQRYGMPREILCDYGPPWGSSSLERWTALGVWLLRRGVSVIHGRPRHPQTQGKDERFHRTLKADVISRLDLRDLPHAQRAFDRWRSIYNTERPHQSLAMATPVTRYQLSPRPWPQKLPPILYPDDAVVRTTRSLGVLTWRNRSYGIGRAFAGLPLAIRPTATDGLHSVQFCHHLLGAINLHQPSLSKHQLQPLLPLPYSFA